MTGETLAKGGGQNKHDRENMLLGIRKDNPTPMAGRIPLGQIARSKVRFWPPPTVVP
jgi:hypothetical protein